jgi:hypothetical protein
LIEIILDGGDIFLPLETAIVCSLVLDSGLVIIHVIYLLTYLDKRLPKEVIGAAKGCPILLANIAVFQLVP